MTQITIKKTNRNISTFQRLDVEKVVESIRSGEYAEDVQKLRADYSALLAIHGSDMLSSIQTKLPSLCFSCVSKKQDGQVEIKNVSGLVDLEIVNLPSPDGASELVKKVAILPYTYIAFVGADGYSVNVVARYTPAVKSSAEAFDEAEEVKVLKSAYSKLHHYYSSQLGIMIDAACVALDSECLMSSDSDIVFNPVAETLVVSPEENPLPVVAYSDERYNSDELLPGKDTYNTWCSIFEWCKSDAIEKSSSLIPTLEKSCKDKVEQIKELNSAILTKLADNCAVSRLPKAFALRHTLFDSSYLEREDYVVKVFDNAYAKRRMVTNPFKFIKSSTLLAYRTETFMNDNYDLRRNVMTGRVEYRFKTGLDTSYAELTERVRNSMTMRALKLGLGTWDKDLQRYIESDDIPEYNPLDEYLSSLPEWDGKDRIAELANRVPTENKNWPEYFRIWLRSMVMTWTGRDEKHSNSIVPLLIGPQGCGKSSFCRIILPPELRQFYNENINFKNNTDIVISLSRLALINLDEFDKLTKSQQPLLKFLISTNNYQARMPYGTHLEQLRKSASFIGTTNNLRPLTDKTGNRRYVCIEIAPDEQIDFDDSTINYPQLYAQIYSEVKQRQPYYFDDKLTEEILVENRKYLQITDYETMIMTLFRAPVVDEEPSVIQMNEILDLLEVTFPSFERTNSSRNSIGRILTQRFSQCKIRTASGMAYKLVRV